MSSTPARARSAISPTCSSGPKVVRDLLKPGGALYIVEFHPLLNALREVSLPGESDDLILRADYLEGRGPIAHDSTVTYTGDEVPGRHRSYEWRHGLGEIVTTLATTGFHLTTLRESEVTSLAALAEHAADARRLVAPAGRGAPDSPALRPQGNPMTDDGQRFWGPRKAT